MVVFKCFWTLKQMNVLIVIHQCYVVLLDFRKFHESVLTYGNNITKLVKLSHYCPKQVREIGIFSTWWYKSYIENYLAQWLNSSLTLTSIPLALLITGLSVFHQLKRLKSILNYWQENWYTRVSRRNIIHFLTSSQLMISCRSYFWRLPL